MSFQYTRSIQRALENLMFVSPSSLQNIGLLAPTSFPILRKWKIAHRPPTSSQKISSQCPNPLSLRDYNVPNNSLSHLLNLLLYSLNLLIKHEVKCTIGSRIYNSNRTTFLSQANIVNIKVNMCDIPHKETSFLYYICMDFS